MKSTTWVTGLAVALGAATAHADPTAEREGDAARPIEGDAVLDEEQIGEVAEAATAAGTACRSACVGGYAAACLRIQYLCTGATVFTLGGATVPCATGMAAVCLSSIVLGQICSDRCPP
jgi:hypothetical protein